MVSILSYIGKTLKTSSFSDRIVSAWYHGSPWLLPLVPLSWLTEIVARRRLRQFRHQPQSPAVPVVVVGNITVGGTGKTPIVVALCEAMSRRDFTVVVISRGYGAKAANYPVLVTSDSSVTLAGDEPLLIARRTGVPVIIDPDRNAALNKAIELFKPDVVISDDGLQHYKLARTFEIAVLDSKRGLGNGYCLPAGPLREPVRRLQEVDAVVINGSEQFSLSDAFVMTLDSADPINIKTGESMDFEEFLVRKPFIHAVAGIGNPERFFSKLESSGFRLERHAYSDHHDYNLSHFETFKDECILMTEKDAVKCTDFAKDDWWYLPVNASLPTVFINSVLDAVSRGAQ